MTVMYFLGSCENYILFIFVLLINTSFIDCLGELKSGYKKCFFIDNKTIYSTSKVNNEAAERLTKGGKPTLADEIPEAPKDLKLKANGRYATIMWWTNPRVTYGLEHVRHILLKVVQEYTTEKGTFQKTEYTLLNATGKDFSASDTIYSYNCTKFNTGAYRMEATLWFLGNLKQSADGRLIAHITEKSETAKLEKEDIIPALQKEKKEADECICSSRITIDIRALQPEGQLSTEIQGSGLPNDTNIEIQVIKDSTSGKYIKEITYVSSRQIQNPYGHKFNVTRGNNYYIRVLRHCQKGYYVSCQKDEADTMRSESVFMKSGSSHLQPSSSKDEHSRVVTRHTETMQQVLQIATVTFAFGTCILAEVALIFKLMTGGLPEHAPGDFLQQWLYRST